MRVAPPGARLPFRGPRVVYTEDVASFSRAGVWYTVREFSDGHWECSCPAYRYGDGEYCKHITDVRARVPDTVAVAGDYL